MFSFRDLRISQKLLRAFGVLILLYVALAVSALFALIRIGSSIDSLANRAMPAMRALADIRYSFSSIRRSDGLLLQCDSPECVQRNLAARNNAVAALTQALDRYAALVSTLEARDLYESFRRDTRAYADKSSEAGRFTQSGDAKSAAHVVNDAGTMSLYDSSIDAITKSMTLNNYAVTEAGTQAVKLEHSVVLFISITAAFTILMCVLIGVGLTRAIAGPLIEATEALERFASKDLTVELMVDRKDEAGRLCVALNDSVQSVRNLVYALSRSSEAITQAVDDAYQRSVLTKDRAQEQCDQTNQIAAAAQEMTVTIAEISQNAEHAAHAGGKSAEAASGGGEVMQRATVAIERIGTSTASAAERINTLSQRSAQIGSLVTVISDISEQTNLLALNAAIEAARAGEQGRGFAVVAGEVRRLAERTRQATEEISTTVHSIQNEVTHARTAMDQNRSEVASGVSATGEIGTSFDQIVRDVQTVEQMIHLIATATTEQSAASGEISDSAARIATLASAGSQSAEDATQACSSLTRLSSELDVLIREFHLGGSEKSVKLQLSVQPWSA